MAYTYILKVFFSYSDDTLKMSISDYYLKWFLVSSDSVNRKIDVSEDNVNLVDDVKYLWIRL